ncbi:MAG TPA: copper chaperone PCu(A)C [Candidatus Eremiobacteraceae bacterium]|nr:copper chaperone PCu(A)C [Candidatus Eremiobacteraceae bacterium]
MLAIVLTVMLAPTAALSGPTATIAIHEAYSRPANDMGAVFLTLVNRGTTADAVDAARSDVADATEVHETYDTGSGSGMRHVPRLPIAPGQTLSFHSGGYHVMLIGLKHELKAGDRFTIGLHFEHAGWIEVPVEVKAF